MSLPVWIYAIAGIPALFLVGFVAWIIWIIVYLGWCASRDITSWLVHKEDR